MAYRPSWVIAKVILLDKKKNSGTILPIARRIGSDHTFLNGISPKVNVIGQLMLGLTHYSIAAGKVNTTEDHPFLKESQVLIMLCEQVWVLKNHFK